MNILSIDTSADDTSAAVTNNLEVLSNVVWSQDSIHSSWGGIVPSLGRLEHEKKIDLVVNAAVKRSTLSKNKIDAIAVTVGPGLGITLGVGINRAKLLSKKLGVPLIAINHIEAHLLSPLARAKSSSTNKQNIKFPVYGLVISGGNTIFVLINKAGSYKILAQTKDDALGEALDKAGRALGLGYPAGHLIEKFSKLGNEKKYSLPIPLLGREKERFFSYSGLKSAFMRLIDSIKNSKRELSKQDVYDLCASFQETAFKHLIRVVSTSIKMSGTVSSELFVGGGVSQNTELKKLLRKMSREFGIKTSFAYSKKLCGDNAAMIGVAAYFKYIKKDFINIDKIDRLPNLKIDQKIESVYN